MNRIEKIKDYVNYLGGEIDLVSLDLDIIFAKAFGYPIDNHINYKKVKENGVLKFNGGMVIKSINERGVIIGSDYEEDIVFMRYEYLSDIVLQGIILYLEEIIIEE